MRLRRGQLTIEARLDLHGMAQQEAHDRVYRFLETARNNGLPDGPGDHREGTAPGWWNWCLEECRAAMAKRTAVAEIG